MKFVTFLLLFVLTASFAFAGGKEYGKKITLKEKTKISAILENPKAFVGKKVLVEGMIVDVCSKRGCWMELASDQEFQIIKIKVKDGEIIFPLEAKGKPALVEGEVYEIKLTKEEAIAQAMHEAEEHGTKFDSTSVTGPITYYQIKGLGAVIE